MAAQPGSTGAGTAKSAAPRTAAPNNQGNTPGISGDACSACASDSAGSNSTTCATHAVAGRNPRQPQRPNNSMLARWFGAPFMPCFLGLAALRIWLQINEFGGYAQSDNGVATILSNLTYGLTFLIAAAIAWRKPPTPQTERTLAYIAVALMLAAPVLMLAGLHPSNSTIATAGALLVGIAGAFGGGMWACAYTRLPLKPALMYAFASLALGSLGGLAISTLPEESRYIISLFMPALSILCYERARTHTGDIPLGGPIVGNGNAEASSINRRHALGSSVNQTEGGTPASRCINGNASPMRFGKATEHPYDNEPKSSLALIICGIAVFGLALGLSRGFPAGSPVPFELPVRFVHQLGVVAISAGFLWWIGAKGRRISFSLLWRLEIIIAATGAFILMALPGTATEIAVAIVNIADSLMLCVLFVTAQDVARHSSLHPFVIFGGAWAARVLSRDFGRTVVFMLSPMTQSESAVIGCIVFALSLSMVFLLSDNLPRARKLFTYDDEKAQAAAEADLSEASHHSAGAPIQHFADSLETQANATKAETPAQQVAELAAPVEATAKQDHPAAGMPSQHPGSTASAASNGTASSDPDAEVREWLRTQHGLTAREIDVALLIARGRSKTYIADTLFISENTVRTHSKNAYAKLGIHSREELISLFESRTRA